MNELKKLLAFSLLFAAFNTFSITTDIIIYSRGFAVVQDAVSLNLVSGNNEVKLADVTNTINPSSVILLDAETQKPLVVTESKYLKPSYSENLMLSKFEERELEFLCGDKIIKGKLIQSSPTLSNDALPIVEIDGKIRYGLPGKPIFTFSTPNTLDTFIKPALKLNIFSDKAVKHNVLLNYITDKISWKADYNLIISERDNAVNLLAWVTVDNQSGKTFKGVNVRLVNGEINRIKNKPDAANNKEENLPPELPPVLCPKTPDTKQANENYIYKLPNTVTVPHGEQKQFEFIRTSGINFKKTYVCTGEANSFWGYRDSLARAQDENNKISAQEKTFKLRILAAGEIDNSEKNGLGMPLPSGNIHFYRLNAAGKLEFVGENTIEHIPANDIIKIFAGNDVPDISGEKKRTDVTNNKKTASFSETIEIKLINKKTESAEVKVIEKLLPDINWKIISSSEPLVKKDGVTIEFNVTVPPSSEKTISYKVLYTE